LVPRSDQSHNETSRDPTGAARHVLASLAPDGTWLIVEPFANDATADNLNPIGRLFYSASTLRQSGEEGPGALAEQALTGRRLASGFRLGLAGLPVRMKKCL